MVTGTVQGSATLGNTTITDPTGGNFIASLTRTPIPTPTPTTTPKPTTTPTPTPRLLGEQRIYSGHGRHRKLVGIELKFSGALNASRGSRQGITG